MPPIVADVQIVYVQKLAEMMQSFAVLEKGSRNLASKIE